MRQLSQAVETQGSMEHHELVVSHKACMKNSHLRCQRKPKTSCDRVPSLPVEVPSLPSCLQWLTSRSLTPKNGQLAQIVAVETQSMEDRRIESRA